MYLEKAKEFFKKWWLVLILGILAFGLGIWMLCNVGVASGIILTIAKIYFIASGVIGAITVIINRKSIPAWGWNLVAELLVVVLGIILISVPGMAAVLVSIFFALGFVYRGVQMITASIGMKNMEVKGWGWILAFAILVIILGLMLLWNPLAALLSIDFIFTFVTIATGISLIIASIQMSKISGTIKMAEEEINKESKQ